MSDVETQYIFFINVPTVSNLIIELEKNNYRLNHLLNILYIFDIQ